MNGLLLKIVLNLISLISKIIYIHIKVSVFRIDMGYFGKYC